MDEKKVNRGLHGVSITTIVAAAFLLLSHPQELSSVAWYIDKSETIQQNVNVVPQIQSATVEMKIRVDKLQQQHKHDRDSLIVLIKSLQRAVNVLSVGKAPFDSVRIYLNSGERKSFHTSTNWIWRERN